MSAHQFRICPTNALIVEWRVDLPGARWGFYRVCDSRSDAKRSLDAIFGVVEDDGGHEQMDLLEKAGQG